MSPIWKSLSRNVAGQPRRLCYRGGLPAFHGFSSSAMPNPYDESEEMPTAPSEKVLKIVEDISGLTLLEAADMSLLLKKKLKIHNVPVMSMGMNVVQDMWYETLPPPIGPKRMIPSRPTQRDVQTTAKVDVLANAQALSEDSEDYDGLGCVDDELCAEVDEEFIVKPAEKAKSATNAKGGQTKRTKGAIPVVKKNSAAIETPVAQATSSPAVKSTAKQGTAKQPKAAPAIQKPAAKSPTPKAKPSTKKPEKAKPGAEVDSNT